MLLNLASEKMLPSGKMTRWQKDGQVSKVGPMEAVGWRRMCQLKCIKAYKNCNKMAKDMGVRIHR